jgi:nucleoside-diphosphate-sugar epimerase
MRHTDDSRNHRSDEDEVPPAAIRRVLVTGGEGIIGSVVRRTLADAYDLSFLTLRPASFASHVGNITRLASIRPAFRGVDAVVHLAGSSSVDSPWEQVLANNVVGTYNVFEAARQAGVKRVVYASSNHTIGMYEVEGAPSIYDLDDDRAFDVSVPVRPDSLYGVSKVFGEALGRLYADRHQMDVVCLRIGAVRESDDPTKAEAGRPFEPFPFLTTDQSRQRLRAVWLSHRDCAQLIQRALDAPVHWAVVYGVSNNPRRFWDLRGARDLLGYEPMDSAPA